MSDFEKVIGSAGKALVFRFNRIYTVKGNIYFVSVTGRRSAQHHFQMEQRGGTWKIVESPRPPDWIFKHEPALAHAILKQLA